MSGTREKKHLSEDERPVSQTFGFSYDDANPVALVRQLLTRGADRDAHYEREQPELSSLAQRVSEVILNVGQGKLDISGLNEALDEFFKDVSKSNFFNESHIRQLPLLEGAFVELSALERILECVELAQGRVDDMIHVLRLQRNKNLKEALLVIRRQAASTIHDLREIFKKRLKTPISRQAARDLVLRLKQLGLVEIVSRAMSRPTDPLRFNISSLGMEVTSALDRHLRADGVSDPPENWPAPETLVRRIVKAAQEALYAHAHSLKRVASSRTASRITCLPDLENGIGICKSGASQGYVVDRSGQVQFLDVANEIFKLFVNLYQREMHEMSG